MVIDRPLGHDIGVRPMSICAFQCLGKCRAVRKSAHPPHARFSSHCLFGILSLKKLKNLFRCSELSDETTFFMSVRISEIPQMSSLINLSGGKSLPRFQGRGNVSLEARLKWKQSCPGAIARSQASLARMLDRWLWTLGINFALQWSLGGDTSPRCKAI